MRTRGVSKLHVVFTAGVFVTTSCAPDDRAAKAQDFLREKVSIESQALLTLDAFEKTNGYAQNIAGIELYIVEWRGRISVHPQSDVWKAGNAFEGYWNSFTVMTQPPSSWDSFMMASAPKRFAKGTAIELTGQATLRNTEQGWRVEALQTKTSRVLATRQPDTGTESQAERPTVERATVASGSKQAPVSLDADSDTSAQVLQAAEQRRSAAGLRADLPEAINLRDRPEQPADIVIRIDNDATYNLSTLNTPSVTGDEFVPHLKALYHARADDRIVYIYADRLLKYKVVLRALELAARSGACVAALTAKQKPGTTSTIQGDSKGDGSSLIRRAIDVQLPATDASARHSVVTKNHIVLEIFPNGTFAVNREPMTRDNLARRLWEIFPPRPERILVVKGDPETVYEDVMWAMDMARGSGAIVLEVPHKNLVIPASLPDIDLSKPVTSSDDSPRCRRLATNSPRTSTPADSDQDQPYFEFQVEKPAVIAPGSPQPLYPELLRNARVEGEVLVQFVVDTSGRADPSSFKVLKSTHDLFAAAVRTALPTMRFVPAEVRGRKVRQVVQQPFAFSVK